MSLIQCKKCNGPHLTLKCGKEAKPKDTPIEIAPFTRNTNSKNNYSNNNYSNKRKSTTVRISNLPDDITIDELGQLINPWGHIGRINLNEFENKSGFIDFYNKNEADYFIEALDRTPFDNLIIRVETIESKY